MNNTKTFVSLALAIFVTLWGSRQVASQSVEPTFEVVLMSQVDWNPLNPARGDQSPRAGNLWGDRTESGASGFLVKFEDGTLVKLPAGFTGKIHNQNSTFHAVVIQGRSQYQVPGETEEKTLEPGSYFGSEAESVHQVSCEAEEECIIYVRTEGKYDVIPT